MASRSSNEFFSGYIVVRLEGLNPEKFINMAIKYGVTLWDVKRVNFTTVIFKMKYDQYGMLRGIIQKTGVKTKIIKKVGMHFIYKKALRRKVFVLGIGIFLAIIVYMLNIIWQIDIVGNKTVNTDIIYEAAKKAGLKEGTLKYKLNLRDIEDYILNNVKEISVVTIKLQGIKAKIEVVERKMPPQIKNLEEPINVIASKDGIILKISAYMGKAMVKEGDYVKKGQVLISGVLTDTQNVPIKLVHAFGEVIAKTWYESVKEVNINYKYEERTGRTAKKVYYNYFGKDIYIKNDNILFKKYDKIIEKKIFKIGNFSMPVQLVTEYYYEKTDKYKIISYEEATNIALNDAEEDVKKYLPKDAKILDKKVDKIIGNGKAKVRVLYITEENICIEQEIN
ncbi:sporulation protein YqfD [Caloramator sp. E03]|uniref:sporulation protein YqfD n=1 Tax=Caloramator sp. E03 TaxID=2576307 RepID=UPI001110D6ED|nr:sporulation protein YqfD [Caloramator sp. E03]QCX32407.1 sporulation protein YqfD [Caloramator sp. E03]